MNPEEGAAKDEEEIEADRRQMKLRCPKLASFDKTKDDMDAYIHRRLE